MQEHPVVWTGCVVELKTVSPAFAIDLEYVRLIYVSKHHDWAGAIFGCHSSVERSVY
jgi:hypothetical protein